jgi:hypothetical protein
MMMTEDGLVMDNLHGGTCKVTNWVFTCELLLSSVPVSIRLLKGGHSR